MLEIFLKGGPIMWPLLFTSVVALTVALERLYFIFREKRSRQPQVVEAILHQLEHANSEAGIHAGRGSTDFVARTLTYALTHGQESLAQAVLRAANLELKRFRRGLSVLDTIITLAPLLGLLGTVTGMIHAFGLIGGKELGAPVEITGGIAEALIATGFGLGIAIVTLIPFNYLNSRTEEARFELEDATTQLELLLVSCSGKQCFLRQIEKVGESIEK
jgi:biopolymer transport protein ExbB